MGPSEVIQVLQALDVKVLGMSPAEKKAELRAQVGLPRDGDGGKVSEDGSSEKEKVVPATAKASLPKVAPGSTAEKKGKVGVGAVEGVSKPGASAAAKTPAAKAAEKKA